MSSESRDQRVVSVFFDDHGNLVIEVVDSGPLVEKFFGDSDYEFWYRVAADRVDELATRLGSDRAKILETIEEQWLGEKFYELEAILREPGIEARFSSY